MHWISYLPWILGFLAVLSVYRFLKGIFRIALIIAIIAGAFMAYHFIADPSKSVGQKLEVIQEQIPGTIQDGEKAVAIVKEAGSDVSYKDGKINFNNKKGFEGTIFYDGTQKKLILNVISPTKNHEDLAAIVKLGNLFSTKSAGEKLSELVASGQPISYDYGNGSHVEITGQQINLHMEK